MKDLWKIKEDLLLPIFGVCLGLQSLCVEHGAQLQRLQVVKHGQISRILHNSVELFAGVKDAEAVRYHSLHVQLADNGDIEPLAWADDGIENGRVIMGVRHKFRPFWAVQYHPESVRTDGSGLKVMQNFWTLAQEWSTQRQRKILSWNASAKAAFACPWPNVLLPALGAASESASRPLVSYQALHLRQLNLASLCELFGALEETSSFALLDSASSPGRFSILACLSQDSLQITYSLGDSFVCLTRGNSKVHAALSTRDIWSWISDFMCDKKVNGGCPDIPFWGGLVGMLSYELGVETIKIPIPEATAKAHYPDVNLVFVERSIVIDTATNTVYVQSLLPEDSAWIEDAILKVKQASQPSPLSDASNCAEAEVVHPTVKLPDKAKYILGITQAMEHLRAGDSYELCLTAPTLITVPACPSWQRYKALRKNNPAPHSAYLRLHPTTLLASSPERFLSFSRPPKPIFQLRPIKGTVRKAPEITRADAENALAGSNKEMAENLMIVDLIRHDLHSVVGEHVQVKQFCVVEEYETVWQLVSVIEGRLPDASINSDQMGWEVLRTSLPPGKLSTFDNFCSI